MRGWLPRMCISAGRELAKAKAGLPIKMAAQTLRPTDYNPQKHKKAGQNPAFSVSALKGLSWCP